jgi:hypothetical protein
LRRFGQRFVATFHPYRFYQFNNVLASKYRQG